MNYSLYTGDKPIGEIKDNSHNKSAKGSLLGHNFVFEGEGLFRRKINIISLKQKEILGSIRFKLLGYSAEMNLLGKYFLWKSRGIMKNKWEIRNGRQEILFQSQKRKEGRATANTEEDLLLIFSALIIQNSLIKAGL
ncbi:MAG: hypothetical protein FH748_12540 [Balneolaceae bacterium]|nr:hypothetical protein [Balneolaceae bacterium]